MPNDDIGIRFVVDDSALGRAQKELQGLGNTASAAGQQASRGLMGVVDSISKVGFGIFGLQQTFMGFKSIATGLFSSNLQFEQMEVQFKVLLGSADAAKARMEELAVFAKDTPFELPNVVRASKVLQTFGGEALATGDGLRLVGDVAAGVGVNIDDLAMWFGRLYDGLKSGRPVGEAMMRLQELGAISGETRSKIEELQASGADGAVVWAEFAGSMDKYKGMMVEQSKTAGGAMSNIADGLNMLKRNLLQGIFEAAKPGIMSLAAALGSEGLQKGAKEAGEAIGTGLTAAFGALGAAIRIAAGPIGDLIGILKGPTAAGFNAIRSGIDSVRSGAPDAARATNQWIQEHKTLMAIVAPFPLLISTIYTHFDTLKQRGAEAFKAIQGAVREVQAVLKDFLAGWSGSGDAPFSDVKLFGKDAAAWGESVRSAFEAASAGAADLAGAFSEYTSDAAMAGYWDSIAEGAGKAGAALKDVYDTMKPVFGMWGDQIKEIAKAFAPISTAIKAELGPALESLGPMFTALVQAGQALLPVLQFVAQVLGTTVVIAITAQLEVLKRLAPYITAVLVPAINVMGATFQAIVGVVTGVTQILTGLIQFITGVFTGDWKKAWEGLGKVVEGIRTLISAQFELVKTVIREALTAIVNLLEQLGKDAMAAMWSGLQYGWSSIKYWLERLGDKILSAVGAIGNILYDIGKAIIQGLWDGMQAVWGQMTGWIGGAVAALPGPIKKLFGISSPSTVFRDEIGKPLILGMLAGMQEGWPKVEAFLEGVVTEIKSMLAATGTLANGVTPMPWLPEGLPDYVYPEYTPGVGEMGFATMFGKRLPYKDVGGGYKVPVAEDGTILWNHAITHNPMTYVNREGKSVSAYVGLMGPADARAGGYTPPQVINLVVDGQVLAKVVNDANARAGA